MRRLAILCVVAATSVTGVAAAATARPRAQLTAFVCRHASSPLNRAISVTAVMRYLPGTERLALRFELQRRMSDTAPFDDVSGGGLGKWLYPTHPTTLGQQPGDVWTVHKPVVNLTAAVYRFRVTFRWFGTDGSVLRTVVRLSPHCDQR